jgi:hypothetical protein
MCEHRRRLTTRIPSAPLLLALLASHGCASWTAQNPPLAPHVERGPHKARLTLPDRGRIELHQPTVRNDSIVGLIVESGAVQTETGAPIDGIAMLELPETDFLRTTLVVGGLVLALVAIGGIAAGTSGCFPLC